MKTDLKYILKRNKTTLRKFLKSNEINTYERLLSVCEERKFIPVTLTEYEDCAKENAIKEVAKTKNETAKTPNVKTQKVKKARTARRRSSSSPKRRNSSTSAKEVKDS